MKRENMFTQSAISGGSFPEISTSYVLL